MNNINSYSHVFFSHNRELAPLLFPFVLFGSTPQPLSHLLACAGCTCYTERKMTKREEGKVL
jgi:hypothetical protein